MVLRLFPPLSASSDHLIATDSDPASGHSDKQEILPALSAAFG